MSRIDYEFAGSASGDAMLPAGVVQDKAVLVTWRTAVQAYGQEHYHARPTISTC